MNWIWAFQQEWFKSGIHPYETKQECFIRTATVFRYDNNSISSFSDFSSDFRSFSWDFRLSAGLLNTGRSLPSTTPFPALSRVSAYGSSFAACERLSLNQKFKHGLPFFALLITTVGIPDEQAAVHLCQ